MIKVIIFDNLHLDNYHRQTHPNVFKKFRRDIRNIGQPVLLIRFDTFFEVRIVESVTQLNEKKKTISIYETFEQNYRGWGLKEAVEHDRKEESCRNKSYLNIITLLVCVKFRKDGKSRFHFAQACIIAVPISM